MSELYVSPDAPANKPNGVNSANPDGIISNAQNDPQVKGRRAVPTAVRLTAKPISRRSAITTRAKNGQLGTIKRIGCRGVLSAAPESSSMVLIKSQSFPSFSNTFTQ
jgi:hypothetical protein